MNQSKLMRRVSAATLALSLLVLISAHAQAPVPAAPAAPASTAPSAAPPEAPPPPPPPPAAPSEFVKVGDQTKRAIGTLSDIEAADGACYITIIDNKKREYIEVGLLSVCTQKPSLKNKRVLLEYKVEDMPAASCVGDPKCKKREMIVAVVSMKELP